MVKIKSHLCGWDGSYAHTTKISTQACGGGHGWLAATHPTTRSPYSTGQEENQMKKLVGWDKDRGITYQLSSQEKQTLWENWLLCLPNKLVLDSKKQTNLNNTFLLHPHWFSRLNFTPSFLTLPPPPHKNWAGTLCSMGQPRPHLTGTLQPSATKTQTQKSNTDTLLFLWPHLSI